MGFIEWFSLSIMLPSTKGVNHKQRYGSEELGHHPRHDSAVGGGLPDEGRDHALQAGEVHGYKRCGTVMLTSAMDTVNMPVQTKTLGCG